MAVRVLLGMSGGVDSSAAACILKERGYDVCGVTLKLHSAPGFDGAARDASDVCKKIGIKHITKDFSDIFNKYVVDNFINEYRSGRTPNPCVMCNSHVKFGAMLDFADELDMDYIATGHYAKRGIGNDGKYTLEVSDSTKDQTYALYRMTQKQLSRAIFPAGEYEKEEIRKIAMKAGLAVASKHDSQEICFVPDGNYAGFIEDRSGPLPQGDFIGPGGVKLGRHMGLIHYTVGQRRGLNIPYGERLYVTRLDPLKNQVILGKEGDQCSDSLKADHVTFISGVLPSGQFECFAKIRYNGKTAPAMAEITDGILSVKFKTPQRAITPGQSVVLYKNGRVLGGGIIIL